MDVNALKKVNSLFCEMASTLLFWFFVISEQFLFMQLQVLA